jgi:hypothetical protein
MFSFLETVFHKHKYEFISMKPNGKNSVDHAYNIRPEYDAIERCSCGKEIIKQYMSYADKPINLTIKELPNG